MHCLNLPAVIVKSSKFSEARAPVDYVCQVKWLGRITARGKISARRVFFCRKTLSIWPPQFHQSVAPLPRCVSTKGMDRGEEESGGRDMQFHEYRAKLSAIRSFAAPAQCPRCGDVMVAPVSSEFVEDGEIRHHWECEACGELSSTSIPLISQ
jgi:hypothetical protein